MKIFLDDQLNEPDMPIRQVPPGWVGVKNFSEFKKVFEEALVRREKIEGLDFDNDLGPGEKEGWEIAKWLTEEHPEIFEGIGELKAHSQNRADSGGKERIESLFEHGRDHWRELIEAKSRPDPWAEFKIDNS